MTGRCIVITGASAGVGRAAAILFARQGCRDQPLPPGRRDNLHRPVPGDHGAHGRFDSGASSFSWQLWLATHRAATIGAGLVVLILLGVVLAAAPGA